MTATIDTPPDIAAAQQALDTAENARQDLETRFVDGDSKVKAGDIVKADEEVRLCRLRLDAARRRLAQQNEEQLQRDRQAAEEAAHDSLRQHAETVDQLHDQAVDALAAYLSAVQARNADLLKHRRTLMNLGFPHETTNGIFRRGGVVNDVVGRGRSGETIAISWDELWVRGEHYAKADPSKLCKELVEEADTRAGRPVGRINGERNYGANVRF
ncbi:hypothetical protein [Streptomyces pristinaespiralis]|uniref:hypothetical protein n=1 Tax=Streptomyces pristinaespiralis TaxID=38300 RepID=UPI0038324883